MSQTQKTSRGQVRSPVTPRPIQLPFDDPNFSWDRFESFCADFISKLPGVKECHRYGTQGDDQKGIDIFADLDSGERWAFQCKRYKQFSKKQVQKAIQETTYEAKRYILLLSRTATSDVRNEIDKHPNWALWDVHDISKKVRELPLEIAKRIVETHFGPEWRKAFLGSNGLTTFVSPENFFSPFLNPAHLFNHTLALVGRADFLNKLLEFVASEQTQIAIFTGRGGIGKTKVLHAFSEEFDNRHPNWQLRFLVEGVPITSESLNELPVEPCVIVVDDAHRREDLPILLAAAQQRPQPLKLILSTRPQGIDLLQSLMTRSSFDSLEIVKFNELQELSREEVEALARQVLGSEYAHLVEHLADLTLDCPLITVLGGRLLAEKQVSPQLLERNEEFRQQVLGRLREVSEGKVSDRIQPERCQSLLKLISATAPINSSNSQFQQAAAKFLSVEQDILVKDIDMLEVSGVLLRRGDRLRIAPDVLSDFILHDACLTERGEPTGYAQKVFEKFKPLCLDRVLRNLAELDWRNRTSGQETKVLDEIWQTITEEFRMASNYDKYGWLDLLTEVAYYQPGRMLQLVEFAMRNPATTPDDKSTRFISRYTLDKLPELLKNISYTLDYLPRCCCGS